VVVECPMVDITLVAEKISEMNRSYERLGVTMVCKMNTLYTLVQIW